MPQSSSDSQTASFLLQKKEVNDLFNCSYDDAFRAEYAAGGFDAVIGNPPYVKLESIRDVSESLSKMQYETFDKRGDLYVPFVEKGFCLLKKNGVISYIMPNKWLQAGYGKKLREYLLTKQLDRIIDFGDIQIFEGATTYPVIFVAKEDKPAETFKASLLKESGVLDFESNVENTTDIFQTKLFSGDTWVISSGNNQRILERLNKEFRTLKEFVNGEANYGIKPGLTEAFIIDESTRNKITTEDLNAAELIKPFIQGRDIKRYIPANSINYMIVIEKGFTNGKLVNASEQEAWDWFESNFQALASWLKPFQEKAKKRGDKGEYWWELRACEYYDAFLKPKIMYQKFQVKPCFIYDEKGLYCNDSMWIIPTENKALLGVLNSKMGWWLITKYCTQIQNGCQLIWKYFGRIPVPDVSDSPLLEQKVNTMISLKEKMESLKDIFINLLLSKFSIDKLTTKLQNWYELRFGEFLKELKKAKIKLSLSEEAEWMQYFSEQKQKAQELKSEINRVDAEIDKMVYQIYGLTEEEIKIVEGEV